VAWLAFEYGREWAGLAATDTGRTVRRLRQTVAALEAERDSLRQLAASLERSAQIDRAATRLAQTELMKLQAQKQELAREAAFLRSLVEENANGVLRIRNFKLQAGAQQHEFSFRFTVVQMRDDFGVSKGAIEISVAGLQGDEMRVLGLAELMDGGKDSLKMRFRHFQDIQGAVVLPDGFLPDSLTVNIKPDSDRLAPLREVFEWN
jgi:hypothetical protein